MKHKPSDNGDKSFLEINEYELEREWVGQPKLAEEWYRKLAKAEKALDDAEDELELVKAETAIAVRTEPEKFGVPKVTDDAIKSTVTLQDDVQDALKAVREAKYAVGVIKAATKGIENRKSALEKLVELWNRSYYSEPSTRGATREFAQEATKRAVRGKAVRR